MTSVSFAFLIRGVGERGMRESKGREGKEKKGSGVLLKSLK
jgi:hypothetical protein